MDQTTGFLSGNYARIPNEFFENGTNLSKNARELFTTLCYFRNSTTGATFPSYPTIKLRSRFTRNEDIANAIAELEYFGWIKYVQGNSRRSNHYDLQAPQLECPTKEQAEHWRTLRAAYRATERERRDAEKRRRRWKAEQDQIPF